MQHRAIVLVETPSESISWAEEDSAWKNADRHMRPILVSLHEARLLVQGLSFLIPDYDLQINYVPEFIGGLLRPMSSPEIRERILKGTR